MRDIIYNVCMCSRRWCFYLRARANTFFLVPEGEQPSPKYAVKNQEQYFKKASLDLRGDDEFEIRHNSTLRCNFYIFRAIGASVLFEKYSSQKRFIKKENK